MAVAQFIRGWSPGCEAMQHARYVGEVNQGGNYILTAIPSALQAMWTGRICNEVATASTGALQTGSTFLKWVFNPLISGPVALLAAAVREGFYESSIAVPLPAQVKHFRCEEVAAPIKGTITLQLEGVPRHFLLGEDVTHDVNNSVEIVEKGKKRSWYYREAQNWEHGRDIKELNIRGVTRRVRLIWDNTDTVQSAVKIEYNGRTRYVKLGIEVPEPVAGTVETNDWPRRYFQLGAEIAAPAEGSVTVTVSQQVVHYELGKEQAAPSAKTHTFTIDGKKRHFLNVRSVPHHTFGIAEFFNAIPRLPLKLPRHLGMRTVAVAKFITEHFSKILRVITAIACAALYAVGSYYVATGILLTMVYRVIDHDLGLLPHKVALFTQKWLPIVSLVGLIFVGSLTTQVISAATLALYIPRVNQKFLQTVDKGMRRYLIDPAAVRVAEFFMKRERDRRNPFINVEEQKQKLIDELRRLPLLEQIETPPAPKAPLTHAQIQEVLQARKDDFEIDPAHCSVPVQSPLKWKEDANLDRLLALWDTCNWVTDAAYGRILRRLADDDRFIVDFLQNKFPAVKRFTYRDNPLLTAEENTQACAQQQRQHRDQIDNYIHQLAQQAGQTKQQFAAQWARGQLGAYIQKLQGKQVIQGPQSDLEDAIAYTKKIIPLLASEESVTVKEDALLKLAMEGGDYCGLAMKRASGEIFRGREEHALDEYIRTGNMDPAERMALLTRRELEKTREQIIKAGFQYVMKSVQSQEALKATAADVHLYEAVSKMLKLGFLPISEKDRATYGLTDLLLFDTANLPARGMMMHTYAIQMGRVMNEVGIDRRHQGQNQILENLRLYVQRNPVLSAAEKEQLLNGPLANTAENLADLDLYPKIHRLQLYLLGVYRWKPVEPA